DKNLEIPVTIVDSAQFVRVQSLREVVLHNIKPVAGVTRYIIGQILNCIHGETDSKKFYARADVGDIKCIKFSECQFGCTCEVRIIGVQKATKRLMEHKNFYVRSERSYDEEQEYTEKLIHLVV
ncbi:hypothetical protein PFISCL1PPCAC_18565, partial [Pristionchus fissidentatus]